MTSYSKSISNKLLLLKKKERTNEISVVNRVIDDVRIALVLKSNFHTLSTSLIILIDKMTFISRSVPIEKWLLRKNLQ